MSFPTVSNDMLPGNMIAFSMPVAAGPEGTMQFRYDPKSKNLYCDLKGEDGHGMPAQFDNVRLNAQSTNPQLQEIWGLAASYRAMYDAEYAESMGEDVAEPDEGPRVNEALSQESPIKDVAHSTPSTPTVSPIERPKAVMADELLQFADSPEPIDEFFTKDMMVATTQRENDRILINTLKEVINQYIDPKEKVLPIIESLVHANEDMYARNFGEGDDDGS